MKIIDQNDTETTFASENQVEDAEIVSDNAEPEMSDADKAKMEKFFRSNIIRKNLFTVHQIYHRLKRNKLTIEDLRQEVIDKKSPLSSMQRQFLMAWKPDFMQQLIDDIEEAQKIKLENYAVQS